jgi:hypothetical protein
MAVSGTTAGGDRGCTARALGGVSLGGRRTNVNAYGYDYHVADGGTTAMAAQCLGQTFAGTRGRRGATRRRTAGVGDGGGGRTVDRQRIGGEEGYVGTKKQDSLEKDKKRASEMQKTVGPSCHGL